MKHFSLLIILLVFAGTAGYSQAFQGGVLGGLNASQVDGDSYSGYNKPGIVAGGYVLTNLSRTIFSGMEIKFAQKGSRKNPNPKIGDQDKFIMRLNYIDLPVYLGVHVSERSSILAGVSAGYLISGTEYDNYGKFQPEDQHPFNSFDFQGFLGFRFKMTERLSIDMRGAYSLVPIRPQPGTGLYYWISNQFNNVLNTTLLYRLDF
ncbi:MAG TPA: hypothetical protein DCL77_20645 [Prolixibacteraceae bacterium]|jgi:opacity protein-like surface antigen|nr:hypothetical protein [Prolixibacteraceae bacterium]